MKDEEKSSEETELSTGKKVFWSITALGSFVYMFIPEATDLVPIIGWLDEGAAGGIFLYSLSKLGIQLPILGRLLQRKSKK
ncbi:MAG: hypothetical protein H7A25_04550 [Leptospiraceae bacterium]|nr:hypothetical protein [Leptospiraceae bacterium]MCP5499146.1 hypothetical protein [Leptospiraceae bacterium]